MTMSADARASATAAWLRGPDPSPKRKTWQGYPLIAHALGRIEGHDYTNSREAMDRAYRRGLRLFEADVALTSDEEPVLVHGWGRRELERLGHVVGDDEEPAALSAAQFLSAKIDARFTTQHLSDLYAFLQSHSDARVLFDIRPQTGEATRRIYDRIAAVIVDPAARARCMAGCYSREMVEAVAATGHFELINLYFDPTLYDSADEFAEVCRTLEVSTASVDSATVGAAIAPLHDAGVAVLQFGINRGADVVDALARGVDAVGVDETAPEQVKRAGEVILTTLAPYSDDRGNVIHFDGGKPPASVTIRIRGRNNVLRVDAGARLKRLDVLFDNDNARVTVGSTRSGIPLLGLRVRAGQDSTITVGRDVTTTGSVFLSAVEGAKVIVGDDVMFATNNEVRADDAHAIYDVKTGKRLNRARSIVIGDHVWFARNAVALGGARIGSGTVIGYGSLVKSPIPNNCIAVGTPARVQRRDIAWERAHLDDFPPYKTDASVVEVSPYWHLTEEPEPSAQPAGIRSALAGRLISAARRLSRAWRLPAP